MGLILAILIFGTLIFVHEAGHMILAKLCDIKVNNFMIGFGPKIIEHKFGETNYSLCALPFGGACSMEGEDTGPSADPRAFTNKPVWQRFLVVVAGPMFNLIFAFILSLVLMGSIKIPESPVITGLVEGSPAEAVGLQVGDRIVELNGQEIYFANDLNLYSMLHHRDPALLTYERDGKQSDISILPVYDDPSGTYMFGFTYSVGRHQGTAMEILEYAFHNIGYNARLIGGSVLLLFTDRTGVASVSGPIGIIKEIGQVFQMTRSASGIYMAVMNLINIAIMLSVNLGLLNLIPIPGLDGGRLAFITYEIIFRHRMAPEKEGMVHLVGTSLLLILVGFVFVSDIIKLTMPIF